MPKPDRRTERTRAALMSAFIQLMLTDGYEAVTVERIAERANVGRSTFYMHYTGRDDILAQAMARPSGVLAVLVGNTVPTEILIRQLTHFYDQRRRNGLFFKGQPRAIWVRCLSGMIEPRIEKLSRHLRAHPVIALPLAATQIAEMQLALIANWLAARSPTKVEAIAEALTSSTQALTAALLRVRSDVPLLIPGEKVRFQEV